MKVRLVLGAVGVLALVSVAAPAQGVAAPVPVASPVAVSEARAPLVDTMTEGTVVSFRRGKLRVASRGKTLDFVVTKVTMCGAVRPGGGSAIRCADLGQKRYRSERVRVRWTYDLKKRRMAASIILMLK